MSSKRQACSAAAAAPTAQVSTTSEIYLIGRLQRMHLPHGPHALRRMEHQPVDICHPGAHAALTGMLLLLLLLKQG